jgi:hypothetical protein
MHITFFTLHIYQYMYARARLCVCVCVAISKNVQAFFPCSISLSSYRGLLFTAICSKVDLYIFLVGFMFSRIVQKCYLKISTYFENFLLFKFQDATFCGSVCRNVNREDMRDDHFPEPPTSVDIDRSCPL